VSLGGGKEYFQSREKGSLSFHTKKERRGGGSILTIRPKKRGGVLLRGGRGERPRSSLDFAQNPGTRKGNARSR